MRTPGEVVEQRLLGACLTHPPTLRHVMAEIRPDEFTHPIHRAVYDAMLAAHDAGHEFDDATLTARLVEGGLTADRAREALNGVLVEYGRPEAWREYVVILHREAMWSRTGRATAALTDARARRDTELRDEAMVLLTERVGGGWDDEHSTLVKAIEDRLEGVHGTYLATPFQKLDRALGGGMVPGEVTVVGGWTSQCKSVFCMQTGDALADRGADVLYATNEMRRDEVGLRVIAGHGGPSFIGLRAGQVTSEQWSKVMASVQRVKMKIVDAHARTCEEVCSLIGSRRPDLAIIDLFNRLPRPTGKGTRELDEQVNRICDTAARSNTHVLLVSQLNRARLTASKDFPQPSLGDLRDTGTLETHPANVLFTYMPEVDGVREGYVEVAKARNGEVGVSVQIVLNPARMRLLQTQL